MSRPYRYARDEDLPIEVLVFRMDPAHVDAYLDVDHEVWTLGEAMSPVVDELPFLSKEVWLDRSRPGEVTLVFVWESMAAWDAVGRPDVQAALQAAFDARFPHPIELIAAPAEDRPVYRWSRFERVDSRAEGTA